MWYTRITEKKIFLNDSRILLQINWRSMMADKILEKSQGILLEVVIETVEKSGNFIIQNHDSPSMFCFVNLV